MDSRHDGTSNGSTSAALALPSQARLPIPVMLLWLCAFAGLVAYTASWYVPGLASR